MNENLYVKATGTSHLAAVIKRMLDNGQLDEAGVNWFGWRFLQTIRER
jgi:hypothetical protein